MKNILKNLILIFTLLITTSIVSAKNVTLAWDHSPSTSVSNYRIYQGGSSGTYTNQYTVGYTNTLTISNISYGTFYFVATALDTFGLESLPSNEVIFTNDIPMVYVVNLAQTNTVINEGTALLTFFITSTYPSPTNMIINCRLSGTAINGVDYRNVIWHAPSGRYLTTNLVTVPIATGMTLVYRNIEILNDTISETNKSIIITLDTGTGYVIGTQSSVSFVLVDNDIPPSAPTGFRILSISN